MTKREAERAAELLRAFLGHILAMVQDGSTDSAADLRRAVGALTATSIAKIAAGSFGSDLLACFEAARLAGAGFVSFARIATLAATMTPIGNPSIAVVVACLRFAAIQQAKVLAGTTFKSRAEVADYQAQVNATFGALEDYAADTRDQEAYRALVALQAAVTRDLAERGRPLPRLVPYSLSASLPALALANRLYADADRADELREEASAPHPLFMPRSGLALSA